MSERDDLGDLLPVLEPPAGGLDRLRQSIRATESATSRAKHSANRPILIMLAAAAVLAIAVSEAPRRRAISVSDDPVLAALSESPGGEPLRVLATNRLAAVRVPTSAAVVYFWVDGVAAR